MAVGVIKFASIGPTGFNVRTTATESSGVSTRSSSVQKLARASLRSLRRSRLNFTDFDVNGSPLWNFTPFFSLKVQARPSGDVSQDSAREGTYFPLSSS